MVDNSMEIEGILKKNQKARQLIEKFLEAVVHED